MKRKVRVSRLFVVLLTGMFSCSIAMAQKNGDSLKLPLPNSRITKEIVSSLTRSPQSDTLFNTKSEEAFLPYEGKIIRKIMVRHVGFERDLNDSSRSIRNTIVKIGDALHTTTKDKVILDHMFVKVNRPLNAYKVADNERFLRDLEFILDARIDVRPVRRTDSVDLIVYTRDVFSLGGSFRPRQATRYEFSLYDVNLLGQGQRLRYSGLVDNDRSPQYGHEILYRKSSIAGSLANLSVGYTTLNTASSYGDENEYAFFLRLSRPLISPYTRIAGGLEWSRNWARNVTRKPDSLYLDYTYNVYDAWAGYNIGNLTDFRDRNRHFVAIRYFHQDFGERPLQEHLSDNIFYNDNSYILGQLTFYRQNFYKTRFIYGFGRTEDVPYGHTATITSGWSRFLGLNRFYLGAAFEKRVANKRGDFYEATIQASSFVHEGESKDAVFLFSGSWFSRLLPVKNFKVRQYLQLSYTALIDHNVNPLLNINNEFGVQGFATDSLRGIRRVGFRTETVVFTNWKLLGFNFAPLTFVDVAFLGKAHQSVFYDKPYLGLGAGLRTRNENLVFGTIEARFTYYPRVTEALTPFKVSLFSNLRIKFTGTFVRPPSILQYNTSFSNGF